MCLKAIGSNLIPGENLNDIQNVFITTNTSYKTIYFSYPIVSSIFFLILILFFIFDYKDKLIVIFILFCTIKYYVFQLALIDITTKQIESYNFLNLTLKTTKFIQILIISLNTDNND